MTRSIIPATIEEAEAQGWEGLNVTCSCMLAVLSWRFLARRTRERRLAVIVEKLRCGKCRSRVSRAELYRSIRGVATGPPEDETLALWPPAVSPPAP
jgi:hypothetical protein